MWTVGMLKDRLETYVEKGYIRKTKHPKHNLYIYNYTQSAQFEKKWNKYTKMARGLVLDGNGNIIARPFGKFFNLGELGRSAIPNKRNFEVFEKYDGSLGICFNYQGEWIMATRGSFVSEQSIEGRKILEDYDFEKLDSSKTYLFEIIY